MSKIGKINIAIPEKVKVLLTGNNINIEGISQIEKEDIKYANKLGYKIKPIVLAAKRDDIFELRVSPALISKSSTLSSVKYDNNGISIYIKYFTLPNYYGIPSQILQ